MLITMGGKTADFWRSAIVSPPAIDAREAGDGVLDDAVAGGLGVISSPSRMLTPDEISA
jgi:hypothetical protein